MSDQEEAAYRRDGEVWCIDLRLKQARQFFDLRDPAPFNERDLDPGAAEYLRGAINEIPERVPVRLDVYITDEATPTVDDDALPEAIHGYFGNALALLRAKIRGHMRQGQVAIVVGVLVLSLLLTIAKSIPVEPGGPAWRELLKEGLTIGAWVAIWRPVEHFLYDWWPFLQERRMLTRLASLSVRVHWGARGPAAADSPRPR